MKLIRMGQTVTLEKKQTKEEKTKMDARSGMRGEKKKQLKKEIQYHIKINKT